jgi:hypothetical protein
MADIGHGSHSPASDLHLDALASIQVAFRFISIEIAETNWVDVEEKAPADNSAGLWEDERIPYGGVDPLKTPERRVNPLELLTSKGCNALRVREGPIDKEMNRLLAWHASSSANTPRGLGACSGR